MKKKFVLTLALVLMVAATLVAATPLEVSGSFKAGYKYTPGDTNDADVDNDFKATINAAVASDFWKVTIANDAEMFFGEKDGSYYSMKADLYLTKALAEQGMDMGDLDITLHVGKGVSKGAPSVLADKNDYRDGLGIEMASAGNMAVTVKYTDLVTVFASVDPTVKTLPMAAGATFLPVDGVEAALGFSNDFNGGNGFAVSAKADVAKLAGLDFALCATAELLMDLGAETNMLTADVAGDYEGIGLWVAFQNDAASVNKLAAKASYATKVEDIDLSAGIKISSADLADFADNYAVVVDAAAKYALGGATYALAAEYTLNGDFILKPSVSIAF